MKHTVYVTETNFGTAEVEAGSPKDAEKLAEDSYISGEVEWESTILECNAAPFEDNVPEEQKEVSNG